MICRTAISWVLAYDKRLGLGGLVKTGVQEQEQDLRESGKWMTRLMLNGCL